MRRHILIAALALSLLLSGCQSSPRPTRAPANPVPSVHLDNELGLPLRLVKGWRVRETTRDSIWLIGHGGELVIARKDWAPAPDYRQRVEQEAEHLREGTRDVGEVEDTVLFGEAAVSLVSTERSYSRLVVASKSWLASAHFQAPLSQQMMDEVASTLTDNDATAPIFTNAFR